MSDLLAGLVINEYQLAGGSLTRIGALLPKLKQVEHN
jgi:hypothetical protein